MNPINKYFEPKPAEHTDRADAWIARVRTSASGKTVYFNNMALKRSRGNDPNHFDIVSGEDYWISGVERGIPTNIGVPPALSRSNNHSLNGMQAMSKAEDIRIWLSYLTYPSRISQNSTPWRATELTNRQNE